MSWAFAIVNKVWGHCYVNRSEYKTKKEQKWIDNDTKKYQFAYQNKKYRRKNEEEI